MQIFIITKFKSNCWGHGGEKRTAQIRKLFEGERVSSIHLYNTQACLFTKLWYCIFPLKELRFIYKEINIQLSFIKKLIENQRISREIILLKTTKTFVDSNLILWESTDIYQWYIPYLCKYLNKEIWAFPHNLESLVPNQGNSLNLNEWLYIEIAYLKKCNRIFTISKEENWLIETLGGESEILPYYPPIEVEKLLLTCRDKRIETKNKEYIFFIIGTAGNPPTYAGLQELIKYIQSQEWPSKITFKVAGFGTDIFKSQIWSNQIEILGAISNDQLNVHLQECSAVIINQKTSSGALTKIIELLIAGVPIICNHGSARSYYEYDGIYIYNNIKNLKKLILNYFLENKIIVKKPILESSINFHQ